MSLLLGYRGTNSGFLLVLVQFFKFAFLIHLKFFFKYVIRINGIFTFYKSSQLSQHHLCKNIYLFTNGWYADSIINFHKDWDLFVDFLISSSLCKSHNTLLWSLWVLISDRDISFHISWLFIRTFMAVLAYLFFQVKWLMNIFIFREKNSKW